MTGAVKSKEELLPKAYFDSSVVIDYFMTEEWKDVDSHYPRDYWVSGLLQDDLERGHQERINERREYLRALLRTDARLTKVTEIRERLSSGQSKVTAVISPLCLLELIEWYAEARFKQAASEAANVVSIQKKSKKEIGSCLARLGTDALETLQTTGIPPKSHPSAGLFVETSVHRHLIEGRWLRGLVHADVKGFDLKVEEVLNSLALSLCSYAQVGATDVMHILFAHHLGCKYIASFDTDFQRIRVIISSLTGMQLLASPEEVLQVL